MSTDEERTEKWLTAVYEEVQPSGHLRQTLPRIASLEDSAVAGPSSWQRRRRARQVLPGLAVGIAVGLVLAGTLAGSLVFFRSHGGIATPSQPATTAPSATAPTPSLPPGGWKVVNSPSPTVGAMLQSVSCVNRSFCIAVGVEDRALIEAWNGTAWSIVPSPRPGSGSGLKDVSCASTTFCVAVGYFAAPTGGSSLVDMWNGRSWTQGNVPDSSSISINSVSCASSNFCAAVGERVAGAPSQGQLPVNLTWDGTAWSRDSTSTKLVPLDGVSCTSATFCMAVGATPSCNIPGEAGCLPAASQLAEVWNGSRWATVPTPATTGGGVYDVDCTSPTFCFAGGNTREALAEAWNGFSWRVVSVPDAAAAGSFSSVSCTTPSVCTLVASSQIQYWDGQSLRAVRPPTVAGGQVELTGVSLVADGSQAFQVAVGDARFSTDPLVRTFVAIHG